MGSKCEKVVNAKKWLTSTECHSEASCNPGQISLEHFILFLSVLTCLCGILNQSWCAVIYLLLLSLSSVTFILTLIGGEGGGMLKSVFPDVHFDTVEGNG